MSTSLPQPGEVVAEKYRIEEPLGEGGMAVVFAAHHLALDKPIALKILSPDLPRLPLLRERFLTEARAAARVDSPHVARVMDVGTLDNGLPYMVLERLEGCDLGELLEVERRLPIGDAVDYVLQALQGLAHAHTLGVVHRDLKPANLFLAHQSDGSAIIKILDFGIAKLDASSTEERISRATQQGHAVGTPMYMSPEHVRNEVVDHRTDIWAIGVVLYELLTGHTPFEADGIGETFGAVLNRTPASARTLRPEIPELLDAAILKCLAQNQDERWADVAQFASAIGPYGTGACAFLVASIEQTLRQRLRRYTGQAVMVKQVTSSSMSITVEAPIQAKTAAARPHVHPQHMVSLDALVTPMPSQFPGLRPRYGRWAALLMVLMAMPLIYLAVVAGTSTTTATALGPLMLTTPAAQTTPTTSDGAANITTANLTVPPSLSATKVKGAVGLPHKHNALAKPR
ncbi:MAG: serine/threonine-protein kinase [Polyangiaceae bacterium]